MKHGLYFHIPFCEQRCYYCAFVVAVSPAAAYEPYSQLLIKEWILSGFSGEVATIYFGGGTPSILSADLLGRVRALAGGSPNEITVEVNPGTLSAEKAVRYREIGINRISLGAQSLEDEDLDRAGRLHRAAAVFEDYELLRLHGFQNINFDLIAGLPNQSIEVWRRNLDSAIKLRPEHVSVYMLDREERSAWAKLTAGVLNDSEFADFYSEAETRLDAAGYIHYEISNWSLPGFECQHNLAYWSGVPYRGFGVGAHSFQHGRRFWNTDSLDDYARRLNSGELPTAGEETLTRSMLIEEAVLLGLRLSTGLDVSRLGQDLGIQYSAQWLERVWQLEDAGLIKLDGSFVKLTSAGRLAATSVIEELLWPTPLSTLEATP